MKDERETNIEKVICPVCKSDSPILVERRDDNGIFGPGYSSWVIDNYYSCKNCGVRFDHKQ